MDLRTTYLGLPLKNPLIPSSSPLSQRLEDIRRLEDAGAAAIVMFSIFEEQIRHDAEALEYLLTAGSESYAEALSYFPAADEYRVGTERYLELIRSAVEATEVPIIGSINGLSPEGWRDYASQIESAGAAAIELNAYYIATDPHRSGAEIEQRYLEVLRTVKAAVRIPVAMKLSPFFSSTAHMARRLSDAGADGLVLFNRFYQPDFDLDEMEVLSDLQLSMPQEMRLPLRWIALLHGRVPCSLAGTTGVHSGRDVAKYVLAGADAVMVCSALLKNGIGHLGVMLNEFQEWMKTKEYESVSEMKGAMSQKNVANPAAFERANYIKILEDYKGRYTNI